MEESFWNYSLSEHERLWLGLVILIIVIIWFLKSYFSSENKLERKIERERKKQERIKMAEEAEKMRKMVQQIKQQEIQAKREDEFKKESEFMDQLRQTPRYLNWRKEVKEKFGNKCQLYVSHENRKAEAHHLEGLYKILKQNNIFFSIEKALKCEFLWNPVNGVTLCKECHDKMESSKKRQAFLINNKQN